MVEEVQVVERHRDLPVVLEPGKLAARLVEQEMMVTRLAVLRPLIAERLAVAAEAVLHLGQFTALAAQEETQEPRRATLH